MQINIPDRCVLIGEPLDDMKPLEFVLNVNKPTLIRARMTPQEHEMFLQFFRRIEDKDWVAMKQAMEATTAHIAKNHNSNS